MRLYGPRCTFKISGAPSRPRRRAVRPFAARLRVSLPVVPLGARCSGKVGGSGGGGAVEGAQGSQAADAWRADTGKYWEIHKLKGGRQPQKDFKMGPYAHEMRRDPATGKLYPVAKFFVSPRKACVCVAVCLTLAPGSLPPECFPVVVLTWRMPVAY